MYAFTFIAPTIILELGYTSAQAQLLTIPIYFCSFLSTLGVSWLADRHQRRWPFIVGPYAVALAGFIGLISIPHPRVPGLTYAFLFTIPTGVQSGVITLVSWVSNNLSPTWKRAAGLALTLTLGNLGGLVGSNIYPAHEAPRYWTGYGTSLACVSVAIMCTIILRGVWSRENSKRDKISEAEIRATYTERKLSSFPQLETFANARLQRNFSILVISRLCTATCCKEWCKLAHCWILSLSLTGR